MATAKMLELVTAEEFGKRPDPGYPEELIRGRVTAMPVPDKRRLNTAHVFSADDPPRTLGADDELILTGILEGFRVRVGRFFE
jgi:hypothetical protein